MLKELVKNGYRKITVMMGLLIGLIFISANDKVTSSLMTADENQDEKTWVDSVFNAMSPEQRLGQLFMIRAHSDKGAEHIANVERQIKEYHVGSLCFFQGTPEKQAELSNRYQALSKQVPLMIAIDGEWGLGMRMRKSTISFPRQLMLGAIQDNRLIYEMGKEIAREMKRIGIDINFAPVADINNNAANPVINTRSFGEDRYNVTVKSYMYMKGMQDHDVMACAKHFPGHGDTDVDSHHDLPIIPHSKARLDSVELYPFKVLAEQGIGSMMVAHLSVPELDSRANRPTTLSKNTIINLLKGDMGYDGLVFTDALEMKGVTKYFKPGEVEAEALVAGNDILLLPEDIDASVKAINAYLADGRLDQAQIDQSVKKVLRAKYRMGLTKFKPLSLDNIREDLNTPEAKQLKRKLIQNALTLVRNKDDLIPFQELDDVAMASLSIGAKSQTDFQKRLASYKEMTELQVGKDISENQQQKLIGQLKEKDIVVVGLHDMDSRASRGFGVTESTKRFLNNLRQHTKVVLVVFGNPYSLKYFDDLDWVLEAYNEEFDTEDLSAQALFGVFGLKGRLPVTASEKSKFNTGVFTKKNFKMGYADPASMGLDVGQLSKIDELVKEAISKKATPGCVVLVAKSGQVVYEKAFGYHTYSNRREVTTNDIFDLASMTKILATTLSVMRLQDEQRLDVTQPLSKYLKDLATTNKAEMTIKDMMAHRAGLKNWIPFYEQTVSSSRRNPQPLSEFYRNQPNELYNVPVTESLFLRRDFVDSIWQQIRISELQPEKRYVYSDLGFYLLSQTIEQLTGQSIDDYVAQEFYEPLGLQTTTFNPWEKFPIERLVPTEQDRYFRRQKIQGYVHDMGAAMLGGISGHAGLFANAQDVAVLMQLFLQDGFYGGKQFIQPETLKQFTTRHPKSARRGIGFDMKQLNPDLAMNMADLASDQTFGHTGFTGTCAWADPEHDLVFVFLSNRTYPNMKNFKLIREDYRERIQNVVYEAMGVKKDKGGQS